MNQNVKQQGFLRYTVAYTHQTRLIHGHLFKPGYGSRSDQKDPDPTRSGSATLITTTKAF
jgi:hypothetical protein